jgi:hypothetical protein
VQLTRRRAKRRRRDHGDKYHTDNDYAGDGSLADYGVGSNDNAHDDNYDNHTTDSTSILATMADNDVNDEHDDSGDDNHDDNADYNDDGDNQPSGGRPIGGDHPAPEAVPHNDTAAVDDDPLRGGGPGGAAAARRRPGEQQTLAGITASLAALQRQVAALQAASGGRGGRQQQRRQQQRRGGPQRRSDDNNTNSSATASPPEAPTSTLWERLQGLFQLAAKAPTPPTDAQSQATLTSLLQKPAGTTNNNSHNTRSNGSSSNTRSAGSSNSNTRPPPTRNTSTSGNTSQTAARSSDNSSNECPRLYAAAWSATVVPAHHLSKQPPGEADLVVACHTEKDVTSSRERLTATGSKRNVTLVHIGAPGAKDKVMVHTHLGPHAVEATLSGIGDHPPKPNDRHKAFEDDTPLPEPTATDRSNSTTLQLRRTVAKDFCQTTIFQQSMKYPLALPTIVLGGANARRVLQTQAATAYDNEATCLIRIKRADLTHFYGIKLPTGTFLTQHRGECAPHWVPREKDTPAGTYWEAAAAAAAQAKGRLAYRSTRTTSLGVVGTTDTTPTAIAPRWYLHGAPTDWTETDAQQWVTDRGWCQPSDFHTRGRTAWFFRAQMPADCKNEAGLALTFTSGITVAPATPSSGTRNQRQQPTAAARTVWGTVAPTDTQQAARTARRQQPPQQRSGTTLESMTDDATPSKRKRPDDSTTEDAAGTPSHGTPYDTWFETVECGGDGDCAYCAIVKNKTPG